jgi:hypothetical protein
MMIELILLNIRCRIELSRMLPAVTTAGDMSWKLHGSGLEDRGNGRPIDGPTPNLVLPGSIVPPEASSSRSRSYMLMHTGRYMIDDWGRAIPKRKSRQTSNFQSETCRIRI